MAQGLVKGYSIPFYTSERRDLLVHLSPLRNQSPSTVKNAREISLNVKGCKLFNIIPKEIRDMTGDNADLFKCRLNTWLASIPDQPTIPGRQRAASSNSLLDQVHQLKISYDSVSVSGSNYEVECFILC